MSVCLGDLGVKIFSDIFGEIFIYYLFGLPLESVSVCTMVVDVRGLLG